VLVCDEFPLFRRQVVLALERADDIEVLGEAPDAEVARTVAEQMAPDVVLLGRRLPPTGGLPTAAALRDALPTVAMALAIDLDDERAEPQLREAVRAGVTGFVPRDRLPEESVAVVRAMRTGRPVMHELAASAVLAEYDALAEESHTRALESPQLTERERAALHRIAGGAEASEAATGRHELATVTASNLVANALAKLHRHARLVALTADVG
jgi:DNA-binding NarL/FixJ family response regulator